MTNTRRLLLASVLSAAATLTWAAPSGADSAPKGTIGDVKASGGTYQGVLTFRDKQVVQVDPKSVTATVDGTPVPISVRGTSHLERTALLLIDTSGSMGDKGMQTMRQATAVYLNEVPSDVKVGVLRFSSTSKLVLKPTTNRAAVQRAVDGLRADGNTALYAAVKQATKTLGTTGDRGIVLLSDGADTQSKNPGKDLAADTAALKAQGIRVDVVRFNNTDPGAGKALAQFAAVGGGSNVLATNSAGVATAFRSSAQALNSQSQFTLSPDKSLSGDHALTLAGEASGKPFTVTQKVSFGAITPPGPSSASAPAPAAATPTPSVGSPPWVVWTGGALLALAIFVLTYVLLAPSIRTRRERRISSVQSYLDAAAHQTKTAQQRGPSAAGDAIVRLGDRLMSKREGTARTMLLIQRADLPLRAGEWLVLRVAAVLVGTAVGALLLRDAAWFGAIIGATVGFVGPAVFLRFKASRRTRAFEAQLPQVVTLVATSLRSGFGLPQALESVARDSAEPAAKELSRALAQVRIGADLADALDDLATRMATESLHMAVMAIRVQRQVGGSLAETLDTTAKTLREREALRGQVAALSAEGRLSAAILIALPIGLFFYMMVVNYDYIQLLWTSVAGLVMMIGTCVMMVIGTIWMRKVVEIEV
ncbi:MAG TPA: type II secretion system F family protein [Flexivirga sp.]|uniref:type II secretion system F family protein n=1 Tax=Flexivirga sp. TaxID=1962927 RepID=UPI002C36FA69|nr:type II secretion system F family protein [Flexivirga sp.]HWC22247.1 type II secretion system F family protein [Flexivirga sp.]